MKCRFDGIEQLRFTNGKSNFEQSRPFSIILVRNVFGIDQTGVVGTQVIHPRIRRRKGLRRKAGCRWKWAWSLKIGEWKELRYGFWRNERGIGFGLRRIRFDLIGLNQRHHLDKLFSIIHSSYSIESEGHG